MLKQHIHPADLPLFSEDLDQCQKVFDIVRAEMGMERESAKESSLASHIIHFYRQGIRNEHQLLILARTAAIC
ncbi:hypothetical protein DTW90_33545 [Neorhizobium sp. P12A]|nr:hypothetical protein DTW90_33545 [Neorhizobium sp. P12A]